MKLHTGQRLPFKRRMSQKTDYSARLALLRSGLPRLVVRRGNANIHAQIVTYSKDGDKTVVEEISKNLKKLGWKCHCGSIPAAYLTGLLLGYKAINAGIKEAVLDIGLQISAKGSAIYAVVKGAKDAGIDVPVGEEVLPDDERTKGVHIENWAKSGKASFKTDATNIVKNFEDVKAKIEKTFGK